MARLARSLEVLRTEVNTLAPRRSKVSDGWIGDPAHAARCSRHNPNDADVVTALDITHDPAGGCDIHAIARMIARRPHPELAYIISSGQTAGRSSGWLWHPYSGSNPHTRHAHFGVGQGGDCDPRPPYDSSAPWGVAPTTPEVPDVTPQDHDKIKAAVHAAVRGEVQRLGQYLAAGQGNQAFNPRLQTWMAQAVTLPMLRTAVLAADGIDEAEVAREVLAVLTPGAIAAAIPDDIAAEVADQLAARLAA